MASRSRTSPNSTQRSPCPRCWRRTTRATPLQNTSLPPLHKALDGQPVDPHPREAVEALLRERDPVLDLAGPQRPSPEAATSCKAPVSDTPPAPGPVLPRAQHPNDHACGPYLPRGDDGKLGVGDRALGEGAITGSSQSSRTACWASPTPCPPAAPAADAARVACPPLATASGVDGAHIPSSNTLPLCGLPTATTVAAVPA